MAWYRAGTVSVANGSAVVTGANTDFVSNTQQGEAFLGPDGRVYEVGQVISATQLTLGGNYQGASAGGQGYACMPTSSFARDLALGAAQLLNTFAVVRDGIGSGLFPDGIVTTPGFRFVADQDTGIYRPAVNQIALVAGGVTAAVGTSAGLVVPGFLTVSAGGRVEQGGAVGAVVNTLDIYASAAGSATVRMRFGTVANQFVNHSFLEAQTFSDTGSDLRFGASGVERMRLDSVGNLLAGVTVGNEHNFQKNVAQGQTVLRVQTSGNGGAPSMVVAGVVSYAPSGTGAAVYVGHNSVTNRSANASGTINASGADYAEYMTKADGCGTIAAGDVCGVDRAGLLTRTWSAAVSCVVKSTDPSLVGGDVWAAHLGPKPEAPPEPVAPGATPAMPESDDPEALAQWRAAAAAHAALVAAYPAIYATWVSDHALFEAALEAWEAELETARQCVDRIAFCGQVPVNVTGDFAVGDYIIAVANGSGIKAVAVAEANITFDQYRRRIGKVWAVRDGRAWVDVQHG